MKKLKERWEVESNLQVIIILVVFTINGSISGYLMKPVLKFIGITTEHLEWYLYWPVACILILPVYLTMLLIIGSLFGQRLFFTSFVKNFIRRLTFKSKSNT